MEYVFAGRTGVRVSRLGFGTMSFLGDADEAACRALFARCRDAGINFFDCADKYNAGRAEEMLGKLVAGCRDEIVLFTKAYFPTGDGPNDRGASAYHLERAVEASLRRLGTDRIDFFFLHRFDDVTPLDETLRAVERRGQAGKILYPAASNFAAWQAARALGVAEAHDWSPIRAVQPMYNLLKRQAESEILPLARAEQLAAFTYSPLGAGLLTGKYGPGRSPNAGRVKDNPMYGYRYGEKSYYEIAAAFTELAAEIGHHPVSLAVAWVAAHPAVTAPLLGARDVKQLEPALAALEIDMTPELYDRIAALSPAPAPATDRNEEGTEVEFGQR